MRRVALLVTLLIAAGTARAAGGMGLRWNSCEGESNRIFACDRSTGSEVLVGSFQSPSNISFVAAEAYLRITVAEGEVPAWWHMWATSDCRRGSSSISFDVSSETDCDDPWLGQAMGGGSLPRSIDSRGVYLPIIAAVPSIAPNSVVAGRTYAFFRLTINHARSNGAAACAGCSTPACISIERTVLTMMINKTDTKTIELTDGIAGIGGAGNIVTWQGGPPSCGAGAPKSSTWGDLKRRFK